MFFAPKMKIYTVHIKPSDAEGTEGAESAIFVREGFSWRAFLFNILWLIYHRLWVAALGVAVVISLLGAAEDKEWLDASSLFILQLAFNLIIGYQANDWRRSDLARRGYIISDIVVSDGEIRAQQRYFEQMVAV